MNLTPLNARVIIRPALEHNNSRLVIPDAAKKISDYGEVVAVGPGRRHIDGQVYPLKVKKGDTVLFSRMRAFPFEDNGVKYLVMDEEEVLGVQS